MKKLSILLVVFMLVSVTAMAQLEGLYAGAEIVVDDLLADDIMFVGVRPYVGYETVIMDEALELAAELGIPIAVPLEADDMLIGIDLKLGGLYNISLSDASKLGFGLNAYVFFPIDDKKGMWTNVSPFGCFSTDIGEMQMWVEPVIKFTQAMDFGLLYGILEIPIIVLYEGDAADLIATKFTAGVELEMGLDVGLTHYGFAVNDSMGDYWHYLEVYGKYKLLEDALLVGATIGVPLYEDGIKFQGIAITLEAAYTLEMGLVIYGEIPISNVAADQGDIGVGLTVGAKFSF